MVSLKRQGSKRTAAMRQPWLVLLRALVPGVIQISAQLLDRRNFTLLHYKLH